MNNKYIINRKFIFPKIPFEIQYILILFIITRITLTLIGYYSHLFINGPNLYRPVPNDFLQQIDIMRIWGVWDSGHYTNIATHGYSIFMTDGKADLAFFPMYPLLMRLLGTAIGNYFNAGIIISNICLIILCIYLFKLVKFESDYDTALNAVKYLFLFPTAFILSGVFTESLYLTLLIICFYYAKKEKWMLVGFSGFFLVLTRIVGLFVIIPMIFIYLSQRNFKINKIRLDMLYLILVPTGFAMFMVYNLYLTGDSLFFLHRSRIDWGTHLTNPIVLILSSLNSGNYSVIFEAVFATVCFLLLIIFLKKIDFPYFLLGIVTIITPLLNGEPMMFCLSRYILTIFPLFIIFAKVSKDRYIDQYLTVILVLLQAFLMVFWTNQYSIVV